MDERELQEIETMHAQGGILPGDVPRLIAEVRQLAADNTAWRERAAWAVMMGASIDRARAAADLRCRELGARAVPVFDWAIVWPGEESGTISLAEGMEESREDAKSACEAAFLRLVGCR